MRYMLDTNICIYAIKNSPENIRNMLKKHDQSEVCISSITYAELMYGVQKSKAVLKNKIALLTFVSNIEIADFDAFAAEEYGTIRAKLAQAGTPIGHLDMLIAAHAKSLGYILVTNNVKEFARVEGLSIENWVEHAN